MAFWEQEWKTHYDPCEQTYNIPEEKIWELLKENKEKEEENAKLKLKLEDEYERGYDACCAEESVDKEFLEEKEEEIAKLQKLVDEYKKSSLREDPATPQEITDYMKELSSELEDLEQERQELKDFEEEVYDTIDHDDDVSRDDVIDFIKEAYDLYDSEMMHELSNVSEMLSCWNGKYKITLGNKGAEEGGD